MRADRLALFLVAAVGGFTLLSFHLRGRSLPSALIIGHGLVAVTAFIVLLLSAGGVRRVRICVTQPNGHPCESLRRWLTVFSCAIVTLR